MPIVGEATVLVRLRRNLLRRDLQGELGEMERDADKSGGRSGQNFSSRFSSRIRAIDDAVAARLRGITDRSGSAGSDSGASFTSRFSQRLRRLDNTAIGFFNNFRRAANRAGDDAGLGFTGRFSRRMSSIGLIGEDFGRSLEQQFSKINIDLPDFGGGFAAKLLALIPLIGVLGGGIAALIGGLTALAASAAYAAGSIAILASGLGALVLGLGTGLLAFSGIGKAVAALGAQQAQAGKTAVASGRSQRAAADAIRAAEQRLADAKDNVKDAEWALQQQRHSAAEQAASDAHAVQQAELALADAQQAAQQAQEDLTQARKDAKDALADLQLQLRGAVLSEEEAEVRLIRARQDYQATLNDPNATALDRREAQLNLEDAELALDEARKRRKDITKETEDANRKGVNGSDEVVAAREREKDANQGVKDAEWALAQARQQQADDAVQNAHAISEAQQAVATAIREVADAQRALAEAHQSAAEGGAAAATAVNNVEKAMAHLSPQAKKFAYFLFGLRPEIDKLKAAAGARLFKPLTNSIQRIVTTFFPALRHALRVTGGGLADFFGSITDAITSGDFIRNFKGFADALSDTSRGASDFSIMGKILGNFLKAMTGLALAAEPVFRRFLKWLERVTGGWADAFKDSDKVNSVTDSIKDMGKEAAKWGHVIGGLFELIGHLIDAALGPGKKLTSDLAGGLDSLNDSLEHGSEKWTKLHDFFVDVQGPFKAVVRFAGELGKQFMLLGANKDLGKLFDSLRDALPSVRHAIENFTNKVAPALIHIIQRIIDIFNDITNTPAFSTFVTILEGAADVIRIFVKALTIGPVGKFTGVVLGLVAALAALHKVSKITGLKALYQSVQVGRAPAGTPAATGATGLGGFVQGARGRPTVDPTTGKERRSSRLGRAFTRQPLATRLPGNPLPGGTVRKGVNKAGLVAAGAVAAGALAVGIAKSDSIGDAMKNVAQVAKDNFSTILFLAGPAIVSKLGSGLRRAGPAIGDAAGKLGGFIKNRISKGGGGGDAGFIDFGPMVRGAKSGFAKIGSSVSGLVGKLKIGAAATKIWTGVQIAFNLVMSANPIVLLAIAIAALVAGIVIAYKKSEKFRNIIDAIGHGIRTVAVGAFNFFRKHLKLVLLALGPLGLAIFAVIEVFKHFKVIKKIIEDVVKVIVAPFKWLYNTLVGHSIIPDMVNTIIFLFKTLTAPIRIVILAVKEILISTWKYIYGIVKAVVKALWDFVKLEFNTAKRIIQGVIELIKDIVTGKWGDIKDDVINIVKALWDEVVGKFKIAKDLILNLLKNLWNTAKGFVTGLKNDIVGVFDDIVNAIKNLPGRLRNFLGALGHAAHDLGAAIIHGIMDGLTAIGNFASNIASAVAGAIIDFINTWVIGKINSLLEFDFKWHGIGFHIDPPNIPPIPNPFSGSRTNPDAVGGSSFEGFGAAEGATVMPRPGGTPLIVGEAGRPESVVDTGLINERLRSDAAREDASSGYLRRVVALLERIESMGGLHADVTVQAAPGEPAEQSVPRALRSLQFELGA